MIASIGRARVEYPQGFKSRIGEVPRADRCRFFGLDMRSAD